MVAAAHFDLILMDMQARTHGLLRVPLPGPVQQCGSLKCCCCSAVHTARGTAHSGGVGRAIFSHPHALSTHRLAQMPVMCGLEATRAIRALLAAERGDSGGVAAPATGGLRPARPRPTRIVGLTANASSEDRDECLVRRL